MGRKRFPLVGSSMERVSAGAIVDGSDQKFVNCFPVVTKNAVTGSGKLDLMKRPGFSSAATVASVGYSSSYWSAYWFGASKYVFAVSDLSGGTTKVYNQAGTQIGGDITPDANAVLSISETMITNVANLVILVFDSPSLVQAYYYPDGGAWTRISDGDFPPNQGTPLQIAGEAVHKDGYMFVQDAYGKIWNSDLNSLSAWTSTSFIDASESPDRGGGLALYNNYIMAFGQKTVQFFQNAGNATGSPLSRVPVIINIGLSGAGALYSTGYRNYLAVGNTIYWIGYNPETSSRHIYRMNGMAAQKVSNPALDLFLNDANFADLNTTYFKGVYQAFGTTHVVLAGGGTTYGDWCFDVNTGHWWRAKWGIAPDTIVGTKLAAGRILYANSTGYQDGANTITMTIQTQLIDHGTDRKKEFTEFTLIADTQTTAGNVTVSYSNNDYSTFSTARNIDMTAQQKSLRGGLGWGRRRAWKIEEAVNRPFRGEAFEVEWDVSEE